MAEASPKQAPDRTNRRWRRLSVVMAALLCFGGGAVLGGVVIPRVVDRHHASERGPDHSGRDRARSGRRGRERGDQRSGGRDGGFRDRLARRLELDDAHQARLDSLLEANRAEAEGFWEQTHSRYRELRLRFREQIREILTETQRETFDSWTERMDERENRRSSERDSRSGRRSARNPAVGRGHR